jgi:glycine reductase
MKKKKYTVVHLLNQFSGGVGGEEKASLAPVCLNEPAGPGVVLEKLFKNQAEIKATIISGDNFFAEHTEKASKKILSFIKEFEPDLFVAGPAFNAGRYGMACGEICRMVQEKLGIPAITAMFPENPAVEIYKKSIFIVKTRRTVAGMKQALADMANISIKLLAKEGLGFPEEENYIPRGLRKNYFADKSGAERAGEMLIKSMLGEEIQTEYELPVFDTVKPLPPIKDLPKAKICLITTGGIVPMGNPDRIASSSASKVCKYNLNGLEKLTSQTHQSIHGGYDNTHANEDPNRILPLDTMRKLEKERKIGQLHPFYYATVGNGTSVANAEKFAHNIIPELRESQINAVILTST